MRKLTILLFAFVCLDTAFAQSPATTIYKGSSELSLSAVTATGPGSALTVSRDSFGNYPMTWTWTAVFTGSPASTNTNLEGSADYKVCNDGAIASSSATLTSVCGQFTATDVGKAIQVIGAGSAGATLVTTISAVTDARTVTLGASASTTVTGAAYSAARWFTLDSSTTTSSEMRHVVYKPVLAIRCNLSTLTGGSSPASSCRIAAF